MIDPILNDSIELDINHEIKSELKDLIECSEFDMAIELIVNNLKKKEAEFQKKNPPLMEFKTINPINRHAENQKQQRNRNFLNRR